jgi:platelet-activating factor acetylhydrolase
LASHGVVVVAPEHRDGSCPVSFVSTPEEKEKTKKIEYKKVPHKASTEVYESRDEQLRIRLWELGLIHEALLKIDNRTPLKNVAEDQKKTGGKDMLTMFSRLLDIHEPGRISFAGHSFGAATMVQFVKSVYYHGATDLKSYRPLFTPAKDSGIVRQITPQTPVMLLDLWTLPIQSPATSWLRNKPMPCYDSPIGGSNLLAILSEAFYKWSSNLNDTKRIVSKPKGAFAKYPSQPGPHIFYPTASAHLSQSDFGVLFPWVTTKVFGAKEPERVLRLNARAMLQVMRNTDIQVATTSKEDLELQDVEGLEKGVPQDEKILSHAKDSVIGWISLDTELDGGRTKVEKGPGDAMVEGEALGQVVSNEERRVA